jgi:hypothetical protein
MTKVERDCLCEIAFAMEDWLDQFSDLERDFSERKRNRSLVSRAKLCYRNNALP